MLLKNEYLLKNVFSTVSPTIPYAPLVRKIYRKLIYSGIMHKYTDELKRVSHRMMNERGQYYEDTRKYLNSIMHAMNQTGLIDALHDLNIHELKQIIAAGVPGDAMHFANLRLKELKAEIKAYIEKKGAEASAKVEIEADNGDEKENEDDASE